MVRILAIDPGTVKSAWVIVEFGESGEVCMRAKGIDDNEQVLRLVKDPVRQAGAEAAMLDKLVIEGIQSMGMAVGAEVFETAFWSGRFVEGWAHWNRHWHRVYRKEVKMHLCGSMRAKDPNIRQALIDRFGAPGTKKEPNPVTYKISKDLWSALAVAVTFADTKLTGKGD